MDSAKQQVLLAEASTAVSFTGLMTAVTIFFTGLLISTYQNYDSSVKVPILFLIISTFGFLFSTLIYANASGLVARLNSSQFGKCMKFGNVLSEYIGVYLLVFAIPLVINLVTDDLFIRGATLLVALGGLAFYHLTGFSLMKRHFKKLHNFLLVILIILEIGLFFTQFAYSLVFLVLAFISIISTIGLTIFAEEEE